MRVCLASSNATLDWAGAAITKNCRTLPRTWKSSSALHAGPAAKGIARAATHRTVRSIRAVERRDRSTIASPRRVMVPPTFNQSRCNSDVRTDRAAVTGMQRPAAMIQASLLLAMAAPVASAAAADLSNFGNLRDQYVKTFLRRFPVVATYLGAEG